jgi:8-oxo-dGTP pyrophosphatase MutT (NUDIX family)
MDLQHVRERVRRHQRRVEGLADAALQRAAVALILRKGDAGAELLTIHRSEREGDPWSGHMAFPGGRQQAEDPDLFATAARETFEEVGIDLQAVGEHLGGLDDLRAVSGGRRLDLVITPFVCSLNAPVDPVVDPREVQSAIWVPVSVLREPETIGVYRYEIGGSAMDYEAFLYRGHTIWGLTYRILRQFLDLLE